MDTIRTQVHHGRLDPDSVPAMEQYVEMLLEEFYYEDTFEDNYEEDEEQEGVPSIGLQNRWHYNRQVAAAGVRFPHFPLFG